MTQIITRASAKDRLCHLIDGFAAMPPGSYIDGFDAEDELTGEKGFAFRAGPAFEAFTLAEGALITELLDEIALEHEDVARSEGITCLRTCFREMSKRATAHSR